MDLNLVKLAYLSTYLSAECKNIPRNHVKKMKGNARGYVHSVVSGWNSPWRLAPSTLLNGMELCFR